MMIWWRDVAVALLIMAAAGLLSFSVRFVLALIRTNVIGRTRTRLDDVVIRAIHVPLQTAVFVTGLEIAVGYLSFIPTTWENEINVGFFVIYLVIVYALLFRLVGGLIRWYHREVAHLTATELDDRFMVLFQRLALTILTVVIIIMLLDRLGVEVSGLVTTLGIGSLAIALAAQTTLADMFAGFTIMVDRPFQVGDRVEILDIDTWGDVVDIGVRTTRIRTRDNRTVAVPNSVIGKRLVVNYSHPSTKYRVETHVGVAYGADIEKARQVMIEAIRAQGWVMEGERVEALFLEFGDSALVFRVRCWIEHYVETRRIIDKMNTALYGALNEAGIEIPFPQRDLRLV